VPGLFLGSMVRVNEEGTACVSPAARASDVRGALMTLVSSKLMKKVGKSRT